MARVARTDTEIRVFIKKTVRMPFAATIMDLENVILSDVRPRKRSIV